MLRIPSPQYDFDCKLWAVPQLLGQHLIVDAHADQ